MRSRPIIIVAVAVALAACEQKKPEPPPEAKPPSASPSALTALLGDAGTLGEHSDPPAPAGDLSIEIEHFVNVDQCVTERAKLDPLVGDALRAIGYDTFLRDACRLLEAAKDKKRETCEKIASSALRSRCQSWVAMIAGTPDACPLQFESFPTRGRTPSCVAVAGKDPRLCAGEARASARATCKAMAARDEKECEALVPGDRPACKRELARWRSLLPPPLEGLAALPAPRGKLTIHGAEGTPDPKVTEIDLASDFARGAVVVTGHERARVELGSVGESEAARIAPSPQRRARIGIALIVASDPRGGAAAKADRRNDASRATLEKLELEVPGEATLIHPGVRCDCKVTTARVDKARGGEISVAIEGTIGIGSRAYQVGIDLGTFTRDVVAEEPGQGPRVIPPVHPLIRGGRDGG